jgi:hypothetical protein
MDNRIHRGDRRQYVLWRNGEFQESVNVTGHKAPFIFFGANGEHSATGSARKPA